MNWDYIIVGAGSAGCALAHALMNSGRNVTVLVLEAGGSDRSPFIRIPAGQIRAIASRDWGYRSQPDPSREGASESWARGRVLGGSSSVNGTMYVRGAAADYDRWADASGLREWSAERVVPIFREMESSDQPGPLRGHSGPLQVRTVKHPHLSTEAFVNAVCASGYRFNSDYNGDVQEGVAYAQMSQRQGFRCSAADAFLKPHLSNRNLKLLMNSTVHRIEISGRRASAVKYSHAGRTYSASGGEVILCGGAINSPQLLMLSGVGDANELGRHGINVALEIPGVGCNLKEHPLINLTYRTSIQTYNLTGGWRQKLRIGLQFLRTREGPISNLFEGVAFLKSSPSEPNPDIQLHFMPVGYVPAAGGTFELTSFPAVTVLLNKSYPRSAGRVRLKSGDAGAPPLIECRLLDDSEDVDTLIRGVETVRNIMRAGPLADLIAGEVTPGPDTDNPTALKQFVRTNTSISYHPAGTCRMGVDDDSVVGPDMRVQGMENLWVADASILPDLPSGNTNAVCMMIGLKLGLQFGGRSA